MYDPASAIKGKQAVFEAHPENAAVKALADLATDAKYDRAELTITIAGENIIAAAKAVQEAGYNFLEDVTAVDWYPSEPRFQITYHILSHKLKQRVRLVVRLNGEEPTALHRSGPPPTSTNAKSSTSLASTSAATPTCDES
jgi:NADH-quinone oxidoreductase subunit C